MVTTRLYLDARQTKNEFAPIKLCIRVKRTSALISLGYKVPIADWDADTETLAGKNNRQTYNDIAAKRAQLDTLISYLDHQGKLDGLKAAEIKQALEKELTPSEETENNEQFMARFVAYRDGCKTKGTRSVYEQTRKKIVAFEPKADKLAFEDITKAWLDRFDAFLSQTVRSENAKGIHFRNIRTVFNAAIDDEITTAYPFRKFKIKHDETPKRSLSIEQLRFFASCEVAEWQERYRDLFLLMFMLCGINIGDLCLLTKVEDGRVNYRRQKTHKLYSIKVEPEAQALIDKYRGSGYLLNILDTYGQYQDFNRRLKHAMDKIIADMNLLAVTKGLPELPPISSYWARHTWATIASDLDIPIETISAALGHSYGCATTAIYIRFNQKKVDEANRKVLDYVLYGRDWRNPQPIPEPPKRKRGRPRKTDK